MAEFALNLNKRKFHLRLGVLQRLHMPNFHYFKVVSVCLNERKKSHLEAILCN